MEAGLAVTETEEMELFRLCPVTFTELLPDFLLSCFEVAVMVSIPDDGAAAGAV